ncbi:hypothetical protein RAA17_20865 [Komagataeibacter rhaeticus]|nr:hypothetical protein [Komagataeibacter rhaeticus]
MAGMHLAPSGRWTGAAILHEHLAAACARAGLPDVTTLPGAAPLIDALGATPLSGGPGAA